MPRHKCTDPLELQQRALRRRERGRKASALHRAKQREEKLTLALAEGKALTPKQALMAAELSRYGLTRAQYFATIRQGLGSTKFRVIGGKVVESPDLQNRLKANRQLGEVLERVGEIPASVPKHPAREIRVAILLLRDDAPEPELKTIDA